MILQLDVGELMLHPMIEANEIDGFLMFVWKFANWELENIPTWDFDLFLQGCAG